MPPFAPAVLPRAASRSPSAPSRPRCWAAAPARALTAALRVALDPLRRARPSGLLVRLVLPRPKARGAHRQATAAPRAASGRHALSARRHASVLLVNAARSGVRKPIAQRDGKARAVRHGAQIANVANVPLAPSKARASVRTGRLAGLITSGRVASARRDGSTTNAIVASDRPAGPVTKAQSGLLAAPAAPTKRSARTAVRVAPMRRSGLVPGLVVRTKRSAPMATRALATRRSARFHHVNHALLTLDRAVNAQRAANATSREAAAKTDGPGLDPIAAHPSRDARLTARYGQQRTAMATNARRLRGNAARRSAVRAANVLSRSRSRADTQTARSAPRATSAQQVPPPDAALATVLSVMSVAPRLIAASAPVRRAHPAPAPRMLSLDTDRPNGTAVRWATNHRATRHPPPPARRGPRPHRTQQANANTTTNPARCVCRSACRNWVFARGGKPTNGSRRAGCSSMA